MYDYDAFFYCVLHSFDCLVKAIAKIDEDFFFDYKAQRLFREIVACQLENDHIDWSIVYSWLKRSDAMKIIGSAYMLDITNHFSKIDILNFDSYLSQIIRDRKTALTIQMIQDKHKALINDGNSIDQELSDLKSDISAIELSCSTVSATCSDVDTVLDQVESDKEQGVAVYHWGYNSIQNNSGIEPGGLYAVAGRPGTGKTTFAMNFIARSSRKCAIISYEMNERELMERFFQIQNSHNKRFYNLPMGEIRRQGEKFKESEIQIFDVCGKNELAIRDIMETGDFDLAVVDHLQAIPCSKNFGVAERLKYNYLVEFLDHTRKATKKGIIFLSQVNRDVDNRRPLLRDMKETACIEELAQQAMFLYERKDLSMDCDKGIRKVEVIIEKSRFGPKTEKDDIIMDFNTNTMNFYEV